MTTENRIQYQKKQKQTKQQNIIERPGTVRQSKKTTTVGSNINIFLS